MPSLRALARSLRVFVRPQSVLISFTFALVSNVGIGLAGTIPYLPILQILLILLLLLFGRAGVLTGPALLLLCWRLLLLSLTCRLRLLLDCGPLLRLLCQRLLPLICRRRVLPYL